MSRRSWPRRRSGAGDGDTAGARRDTGAPAATFEIHFDGRPVPAAPGQTVAAALWADGVRSWRTTRVAGAPRGLFCGIGACFDCLVSIDGTRNARACLVPARPGMQITTQVGVGDEL